MKFGNEYEMTPRGAESEPENYSSQRPRPQDTGETQNKKVRSI